mmetsp:Transcript_20510/g.64605  ORF Transcript_20510/g.64605 Transcript_20510/m.64605 type:complete len:220 (-) Transcript_20510:828-1487(-)
MGLKGGKDRESSAAQGTFRGTSGSGRPPHGNAAAALPWAPLAPGPALRQPCCLPSPQALGSILTSCKPAWPFAPPPFGQPLPQLPLSSLPPLPRQPPQLELPEPLPSRSRQPPQPPPFSIFGWVQRSFSHGLPPAPLALPLCQPPLPHLSLPQPPLCLGYSSFTSSLTSLFTFFQSFFQEPHSGATTVVFPATFSMVKSPGPVPSTTRNWSGRLSRNLI